MLENNSSTGSEWYTRFLKRMSDEPSATPEEIAQDKAERDTTEPVTYETAWMAADRTITIRINQYFASGLHGCGRQAIRPGDDGYEEVVKHFRSLQPGQSLKIVKKLIAGEWIEQEVNKSDIA